MTRWSKGRACGVILGLVTLLGVSAGLAQHRQTLAPHELNSRDAPAPIIWSTPELPHMPFEFDSAEEHGLRIVVIAKHLEQPWSLAFLPDGSMLVTERAGRLRIIRNGVLDPKPIAGAPNAYFAGESGEPGAVHGYMDIALHPKFAENHFLYLTYTKPLEDK